MRRLVSVVIAIAIFIVILYVASSGSIVWPDYWTGLAVALTVAMLGVLYWGFKLQIKKTFTKTSSQKDKEITPIPEEKISLTSVPAQTKFSSSEKDERPKSTLLPDKADITKLNISNQLLDQIYEQSHSQATAIFYDAKFSHFVIQVYPFQEFGARVNIYLDFYSKSTDRICSFRYSDLEPQVEHATPDRYVTIDYDRIPFTSKPWKKNPKWLQFLKRAYAIIKPIPPALGTCYHLRAVSYAKEKPWSVHFEDGFSGKPYKFSWNGKGLDESSIVQEN